LSRNEDGFLSRWAKRKQEVRESEEREASLAPEQVDEAAAPAGALTDPDQRDTPPDDETRQRWIEELEAIDIDALAYESDFSIFMKSWVPGALRQKALRKLWTTNPALAVLDGLNDYDLDYTDKAIQAGSVISSYMPGQGYASLEEVVEKVEELAGDPDGTREDDVPAGDDEGHEETAAQEPDGEPGTGGPASSRAAGGSGVS
jgi:hypothetical protein